MGEAEVSEVAVVFGLREQVASELVQQPAQELTDGQPIRREIS